VEVDLNWQGGRLGEVTLRSRMAGRRKLRCGPSVREVDLQPGRVLRFVGTDFQPA